jgi:predicted SAM-dependent methyltransferase
MNMIKNIMRRFIPRWAKRLLHNIMDGIKLKFRIWEYIGNNVFCPCCGSHFGRFMDFNITGIDHETYVKDWEAWYLNKICPKCSSLPRHRIVCKHFEKMHFDFKNSNILMFASDPIKNWFKRNKFKYKTADKYDERADLKVDIQNTGFSDESWDLIICNHVLEHVLDYKEALHELMRILKKDGILELTVPIDKNLQTVHENASVMSMKEKIKKFGQQEHLREFGNDFEKILSDFGFLVEVVDGDKLSDKIVGKIGPWRCDDNRIYICRKN